VALDRPNPARSPSSLSNSRPNRIMPPWPSPAALISRRLISRQTSRRLLVYGGMLVSRPATVRACPGGALTDRLPRFPPKQEYGTSALAHTATARARPGGAMTDRLPRFPPNNQKEGSLPLGHTASVGLCPAGRQLTATKTPKNRTKCGSLPLGHTFPRGSPVGTQVCVARTPPPTIQNADLRPLVTRPTVPAANRNH
jgi:hypothetical protein